MDRHMAKTFAYSISAPGPLRGSYYNSKLEVPDGRDPNQNAWLTITLKVNLRFADVNQPCGIVEVKNKVEGMVRDSDHRVYHIRNWDSPSVAQFTRAFFQRGEKYWNRRFTLITPQDYDELDFTCRVSPGWHVRPNVLCLFRLNQVFSETEADRNIKVVRLDTTFGEDFRDFWAGRGTGGAGFRSNWELYQSVDVNDQTLHHELGHAIGQEHILALKGDAKCKTTDPNADRCYEGPNVMGEGDKIELINGLTWHERIAEHTKKDKRWWQVVLGDTTPTRKVRLGDWDPKWSQMF
jgi:hypothetical protein